MQFGCSVDQLVVKGSLGIEQKSDWNFGQLYGVPLKGPFGFWRLQTAGIRRLITRVFDVAIRATQGMFGYSVVIKSRQQPRMHRGSPYSPACSI
jgi:hypothetical protein